MTEPLQEFSIEVHRKLKILNEELWEGRCAALDIEEWLANFDGQCTDVEMEKAHALYLLSNVTYFGLREMRVLLRSMYRDLFEYPILSALRSKLGTDDIDSISVELGNELSRTLFLGIGNPAESGTHLLYYFRQENRIHKNRFINSYQILNGSSREPTTDFVDTAVQRYVFIDDVCGSGQQCVEYGRALLDDLHFVAARNGRKVEFHYLVLFATQTGLDVARTKAGFDSARAVHLLDNSDRCFDTEARIFVQPPEGIDRDVAHKVAQHFGARLDRHHPLGYRDSQLLLAFHHNIPDNTLPIIWFDENPAKWRPILPRYPKNGG